MGGFPGLSRRLSLSAASEPLFPVHPSSLSDTVRAISAAMVAAGEARATFQLRDLRRTCETMLGELGVPKDIRAQLQSHGLGGVQDRHYDQGDYLRYKRAALDLWAQHLGSLVRGQAP